MGELVVLGSTSRRPGEVPGLPLTCSSPSQVVQRIKAVETETRLLVVDKETDEYLCSLRLTCTEEMVHSGILLGSSISPAKSVASDNGEVWKPQLDLSGAGLQRHSHSSSHGSRKVRAELGGTWGWGAGASPREHLSVRARLASRRRKTFCTCPPALGTPLCPGAVGELLLGLVCSCLKQRPLRSPLLEGLRSRGGCWGVVSLGDG